MAAIICCYIITFVKLVMLLPKGPFSAVEFLFVCYTGNLDFYGRKFKKIWIIARLLVSSKVTEIRLY